LLANLYFSLVPHFFHCCFSSQIRGLWRCVWWLCQGQCSCEWVWPAVMYNYMTSRRQWVNNQSLGKLQTQWERQAYSNDGPWETYQNNNPLM